MTLQWFLESHMNVHFGDIIDIQRYFYAFSPWMWQGTTPENFSNLWYVVIEIYEGYFRSNVNVGVFYVVYQ